MALTNKRRKTQYDLTKPQYTKPQTRLEANRWLSYATFGAATAHTNIENSTHTTIVPLAGETDDANRLMSIGYNAWVNEQIADMSIPPPQANIELLGQSRLSGGVDNFSHWFCTTAMHGTAQLKLKLAYALSQIFAVNGSKCGPHPLTLYDLYIKAVNTPNVNSFLQLTHDTSLSGQMAVWLTYMGNIKINGNIRPDQNYARERMQLFSIGLVHLNQDGTPKLDSNGNQIPTYNELDVAREANVWTGLGIDVGIFNGAPDLSGGIRFMRAGEPALEDMQQNQNSVTNHETATKVLFPRLDGTIFTIPSVTRAYSAVDASPRLQGYTITVVDANTFTFTTTTPSRYDHTATNGRIFRYRTQAGFTQTPTECNILLAYNSTSATATKTAHGLTTGNTVYIYSTIQEDALISNEWLTTHPNVAPFISKALIKILVTSNPTPEYVRRVANVFDNNGNGVRGDLLAVAKAILLDRESIVPFGVNPNNHGRYLPLIERQIKVMRALRHDMFHIRNVDNRVTYFSKPTSVVQYQSCGWVFSGSFMPFQPRSVFNHYDATYIPAGTALGSINKLSPELQINSVSTQSSWISQVSALTETEAFPNGGIELYPESFGNLNDPRGNKASDGIFINQTTPATVISRPFGDNRFVVELNFPYGVSTGGDLRGVAYTTTSNLRLAIQIPSRPTAGVQQVTATLFGLEGGTGGRENDVVIGETIFMAPYRMCGYNGFPTKGFQIDTEANTVQNSNHPCQVMFHSCALLMPNTSTVPTEAELLPAFNYLESILFSRQISNDGRQLALNAARLPIGRRTRKYTGTGAFDTAWINMDMTYAQKRARMMIGVLLSLPEWSTQR